MADQERLHRLEGELARVQALAQRRQRWLAATAEVVAAVVALPDRDAALAFVARRAREVADAALVMVLLHDEATVKLTVAAIDAEKPLDGLAGVEVVRAGTVFDRALRDQRPIAVDDLRTAAPWPVELPLLRAAMAPFGGIRGAVPVSGLANLQLRAAQRNGDFTVVSAPGDGTKLVWSVPL